MSRIRETTNNIFAFDFVLINQWNVHEIFVTHTCTWVNLQIITNSVTETTRLRFYLIKTEQRPPTDFNELKKYTLFKGTNIFYHGDATPLLFANNYWPYILMGAHLPIN